MLLLRLLLSLLLVLLLCVFTVAFAIAAAGVCHLMPCCGGDAVVVGGCLWLLLYYSCRRS